MSAKIIVLSGDYGYINPITTAIKSIVYHISDVKIYVINSDIPQEWFSRLNYYLNKLGDQIVDLKINADTFAQQNTPQHCQINEMTFGRLLIPRLVPENKVLYLDSDAIVNDNIDELFNISLDDHPLAAVNDLFFYAFNAGVLLINNAWFKQQKDIVPKMLKDGQRPDILDADQTVLNDFFADSYLPLDLKYNYMIGYDRDVFYAQENSPDYFNIMKSCQHPKIIHYASSDKPWNLTSTGRMRDLWWQYYELDWPEIISHSALPQVSRHNHPSFLTFTASDNLAGFIKLAQALPDVTFNVAAWTTMSPSLMQLTQFHNIKLYPNVAGPKLDELESQCTGYLDINDGPKELAVINKFVNNNRPVISYAPFAADLKHYQHQIIVDPAKKQSSIDAINSLITKSGEHHE